MNAYFSFNNFVNPLKEAASYPIVRQSAAVVPELRHQDEQS
jgi:hypothetical protein